MSFPPVKDLGSNYLFRSCGSPYLGLLTIPTFLFRCKSFDTDWEKSTWILLSSIITLFILRYASSQELMLSNSTKPYCKLWPVFQSLTIYTLLIGPNLEKITSRSFTWVMGLSLQINRMFSGGFKFASGKSPKIYKVIACFLAFCSLVASII